MTHLTHIEWELLKKAWVEGNVDDQGSAFGDDADSPREAAVREGYEVLAIADDGSVLAQLGLIDASRLPVAGVESAEKVIDPRLPSNRLMERADG